MVLLLAGVVVGILLSALSELVALVSPEALRGKQIFMLGTTSFLGWNSVAVLSVVLGLLLLLAGAVFGGALLKLTMAESRKTRRMRRRYVP